MSFAVFNLGGGEIILIIALVFILVGATNLPSFRRATLTWHTFAKPNRDAAQGYQSVLMVITVILAAVCVGLLLFEIFKR